MHDPAPAATPENASSVLRALSVVKAVVSPSRPQEQSPNRNRAKPTAVCNAVSSVWRIAIAKPKGTSVTAGAVSRLWVRRRAVEGVSDVSGG